MIKHWLYPGPTLSYIIGFVGVGLSMSQINPILRILIGVVSVIILLFTAGIKLEEYLKKRHKRLMREETRGFKAFLKYMKGEDMNLEDKTVDEIESMHDMFVDDTPLD